MKNNLMKMSIMLIVLALFFNACNKSNVKHGNKRIIGTWKLQSESVETTISHSESVVYSETYCYGNSNTSSSYTLHSTETLEGSTVHDVSTRTDTYSDGTQNTISLDTTYTVDRSFEITFNEDGTCTIKGHDKDIYENGEYEYEYYEVTGTWAWIDSYKEKSGIEINFEGDDFMYMFIDDLTKDELKFNYNYVNNTESEYSYNSQCYNSDLGDYVDYTYTTKSKTNKTETGTRVMKK